jgi:hypothetical protein
MQNGQQSKNITFEFQLLGLKSNKTSSFCKGEKVSGHGLSFQVNQNEESFTEEFHLKQEDDDINEFDPKHDDEENDEFEPKHEDEESEQQNLDELVIIGHKMLEAINKIASSAERIASALENISKK